MLLERGALEYFRMSFPRQQIIRPFTKSSNLVFGEKTCPNIFAVYQYLRISMRICSEYSWRIFTKQLGLKLGSGLPVYEQGLQGPYKALKGLIGPLRPLRALQGPLSALQGPQGLYQILSGTQGPLKALKSLLRPLRAL